MNIRRASACLALVAVVVAGASCGGDDSASPATTAAVADAAAVPTATPTAAPVVSDDIPLATLAPYDTSDIPLPAPVDSTDLPLIINVTVGVDSAVDRIERVALGTTVSLTIVDPDSADEFHLHGFDLGDGNEVPAGQSQTFTFSADQPGEFELESHRTDEVLLLLVVA